MNLRRPESCQWDVMALGECMVRLSPPGHGRIESIAAVPPSAAAGGTSSRRIGVKMDDNTLQFVDTNAAGLEIGDRIQITPEGTIRR